MERVHDLLTLTVLCAQYPGGALKIDFPDGGFDYYVHANCVNEDDFDFGDSAIRVEFCRTVPAVAMVCGFCAENFHNK